jgi:hypothetical protein
MTVHWRKSSRSGGANDSACVEVAGLPGAVGIRDSKAPNRDRLAVSGEAFGVLVKKIKTGALDQL